MKLIQKLSLISVFSLLFFAQSVQANNFFWEFNVASGDYKPEMGTDEAVTVFSGAFGGYFTQLVSYELQYGFGWDDNESFGDTLKVSHVAGMIGLNIGSRDAHLTLMGGVGTFDLDTAVNTANGEGAAAGVSLNMFANAHSGLSIEILKIIDDTVGEYNITSVGYKKKF